MNVADSKRLSRALEQMGIAATDKADEADIIMLNTCVVRKSAEDKALGRLHSLKPLKQKKPDLVIGLMGCLVGIHGNPALEKRFPWVDVFASPSDPAPLLRFLENRQNPNEADNWRTRSDEILDAEFGLTAPNNLHDVSENLPIVLGCSHACAYCVIPHRRGSERSRDSEIILSEARSLSKKGVKELVLLGQIVDRYGLDLPGNYHLANLLHDLSEIQELARLRFLTSHPNWMSDELIQAIAHLPKVMPHIEVPIQAGDDQILQAMRRGYTNQQYRDLVSKIRDRIPGVSVGTDIIVGFPGESEEAFENTYNLLEDLKLDVVHLARYSPRPGTFSARFLSDDVPAEEKMRRFRVLENLQQGIVSGLNAKLFGSTQEVLFEAKVKQRWRGRTPNNRLVFVESKEDLRGQLLKVKIHWTGPWSLLGELA